MFTAQHVSGVFPPIIRSSMTAVAASGFYLRIVVIVVLCSWSGRPAVPTANTAPLSLRYEGKTEATTAVIELLVMGGKTPETCWAVNKHQDNKLKNCCIWLVIYLNSNVKLRCQKINYLLQEILCSLVWSVFFIETLRQVSLWSSLQFGGSFLLANVLWYFIPRKLMLTGFVVFHCVRILVSTCCVYWNIKLLYCIYLIYISHFFLRVALSDFLPSFVTSVPSVPLGTKTSHFECDSERP
jgi:hypothetical protein